MWIIDIRIAHDVIPTSVYSCKKLSIFVHVGVAVMGAFCTELDIRVCRPINNQFI